MMRDTLSVPLPIVLSAFGASPSYVTPASSFHPLTILLAYSLTYLSDIRDESLLTSFDNYTSSLTLSESM